MKQLYRYLPLSEDAHAHSLYVLAGGSAHLPPGSPYPPATHPLHHRFQWDRGRVLQEYQIVYLSRGGGVLETKTGGRRTLRVGDLFVLFPGEWHRYRPDAETGWDEHWVAFQGRRAAELLAEHSVTPEEPCLHTDSSDLLLREFTRITEEVAEEALGYQNVAVARVQLILALAAASHQRRSVQATDAREIIQRAKGLLTEQIDRPVDMQALAAALHVGYSWLRKTFRQYTGMPPAQYQMQQRLNHACGLLASTALPIATVGTRCGFESAYYFARVFRSKIGCRPSEYRAHMQALRPPPEEPDTPPKSTTGGPSF